MLFSQCIYGLIPNSRHISPDYLRVAAVQSRSGASISRKIRALKGRGAATLIRADRNNRCKCALRTPRACFGIGLPRAGVRDRAGPQGLALPADWVNLWCHGWSAPAGRIACFQLAYVAGPLIVGKGLFPPLQTGHVARNCRFQPFKKMRGEQGNVI